MLLAQGEKPKSNGSFKSGQYDVPSMSTPIYPVTKSNLEERIFKTGFHTKAEVMGK
jgi:hypothetical protein